MQDPRITIPTISVEMSGQPPQRVRKNASPSTKQGPMKAMKAFPIVHSPSSNWKSSPVSSPTSWLHESHRIKSHRKSPDNRISPERSPSSPSFKVEKPKAVRASPALKRTGSLDTLGQYLTGQWPRDIIVTTTVSSYHHYQSTGVFMSDKSTQTSEEWDSSSPSDQYKGHHKRSASLGNGDQLKEFRQRLQRTKEGSKQSEYSKQRQSPVPGSHSAISSVPSQAYMQQKGIMIPHIPKSTLSRPPRNSLEGLNPEIEKLVLKSVSGTEDGERTQDLVIPDGHRAPVPDVFYSLSRGSSTRSVDTQTPSGCLDDGTNSQGSGSRSESRSQSVSPAIPIIPGQMDISRSSSRGTDSADSTTKEETTTVTVTGPPAPAVTSVTTVSISVSAEKAVIMDELIPESPDFSLSLKMAASPKPNKSYSFGREPPDGCEKPSQVAAFEEEIRHPRIKEPLLFRPVKPSQFILKPSIGSAFCPLSKMYMPQSQELAVISPATPPAIQQPTTIEG